MTTPKFGIFDHTEEIPGTPMRRLLLDRLELVKMADEGGFTGYFFAEHHGTPEFCSVPNQELMIAAASQITKNIRLGPQVKLLPLHHPVRLIEDLCVIDQLTGGRYDFGVGRGIAPIEHYWYSSEWPNSPDRFADVVGIICEALRTGEVSSENSKYYDFPTMPLPLKPIQDPVPFWYPGRPVTAGRHGMNLIWPGVIDQETYDLYVETWHKHKGEWARADGPNSKPYVACVMVFALSEDEAEAKDIQRRGFEGLVRRAHEVHRFDSTVLSPEECDDALGPLRHIVTNYQAASELGAGTPNQIAERLAEVFESGLTDYIVFQLPCGDMTYEEARRTLELFITEVKPQLEKVAVAA